MPSSVFLIIYSSPAQWCAPSHGNGLLRRNGRGRRSWRAMFLPLRSEGRKQKKRGRRLELAWWASRTVYVCVCVCLSMACKCKCRQLDYAVCWVSAIRGVGRALAPSFCTLNPLCQPFGYCPLHKYALPGPRVCVCVCAQLIFMYLVRFKIALCTQRHIYPVQYWSKK